MVRRRYVLPLKAFGTPILSLLYRRLDLENFDDLAGAGVDDQDLVRDHSR